MVTYTYSASQRTLPQARKAYLNWCHNYIFRSPSHHEISCVSMEFNVLGVVCTQTCCYSATQQYSAIQLLYIEPLGQNQCCVGYRTVGKAFYNFMDGSFYPYNFILLIEGKPISRVSTPIRTKNCFFQDESSLI